MRKLSLLLAFIAVILHANSQNYDDSKCWIWVDNSDYVASNSPEFTVDGTFNTRLLNNGVISYKQALPFAKNPELLKIHEVQTASGTIIEDFINMIEVFYPNEFHDVSRFEIDTIKVLLDPIDWLYQTGDLWHLEKMETSDAWDITQGSSDIHVAVIDYDVDITHPDLTTKISLAYDPFDNTIYDCDPYHSHGTTVASFVAAETTPPGSTSNGQLASIGFNTMLYFYNANCTRQVFLQKALHACNVMNADVIVSCAGGALNCSPNLSTGEDLIVQEILDNGTVIIMAAGNGEEGFSCGTATNYTGIYPFNSEYDERIIVVTSTDKNDYHYYEDGTGTEYTHSHFADVDVCAPGYELFGAVPTYCDPSSWPYWHNFGGTSFSSPIVAGLAALILSVNPCLEPADVQYIIKNTTDPIADASSYPGLVGTGRVNAYQAVLMAQTYGVYVPITSTTTWSDVKHISSDLIIESGAQLTITGELHIAKDVKIVVKFGGKLIIDGGVLTNSSGCKELWQGIELQGKSNESQFTPNAQGQVILKNGAVIENAREGITTIANGDDPHNYDFSATGGIIKANNSTFRNCVTGIHFLDYTNTHPTTGNEIPNISYIKNCTFETTENIAGGGYPDAFIKLENVQWVKILGNTFQNTNPIADPDYLGEGINSIDSKYKVSSFCSNFTNPCTSEVKNQFINLRYGVRATATQSTYPVTVEDAVFDKCHFGVYLGKVGFATVINNEFIVSDWYDPMNKKKKYAYGLYLAQSNDYRVEGNYFHSVNPRGWTGIYISNGNLTNNTAADEIYRNEFDNLYSAIVALNDNDGPDDYDGLTFHCNWFTNNTYDISVMPWTDTKTCVGKIQGTGFPSLWDPTLLVRNYYSADCIGNENRFLIDWNPQTPQDIQHTSYNGANWLPPSGCADYYVKMYGSPYVYNPSHCQDRTVVDPFIIEMELEQLARQKSELNEIIDGGQTALLVSIAQSALPKGQILQSMMEFSPYLSDEVLLALIERPNALPPGTMQQILSANSPLSEKVFTAVQEMTPALPNGILNQIANLQTGELSDRDFVPLVEASYTQKESILISDLVRYYLNDTLSYNPMDSVIKILSYVQYKDAKINLVSAYIETKKFNKAQNLMDSLVIVDPDLDAVADKQELSILKANQPGGVYTMLNDTVAIQILSTISSDTAKFGSLYAMNIIEVIRDSTYEELTLIPTPDMNNRNMLETPQTTNSENNAYLNCYPNPASEKINVEYSIYDEVGSKFILMYNVKGQEIYREELLDIEGVTTITVPETEGTYYIYIEADGAILAIDKIVVL